MPKIDLHSETTMNVLRLRHAQIGPTLDRVYGQYTAVMLARDTWWNLYISLVVS